ncbi:MAG: hypothetical protein H6559_16775 [Lewinellaceae bacterium]|nr:hypothetical protein [Lewinellaceae bacterium]
MPNDNINHLYEDAEGIFWLASKGGGLVRWDRKRSLPAVHPRKRLIRQYGLCGLRRRL